MMNNILVVGSVNIDLVVSTQCFPLVGETVLGGDLQTIPGGKGANQAFAAAMLGARTHMIANVGTDEFGQQSIDSLQSAGVDTSLITRASRPTGIAMITVDPSGNNTIVLAPGANATLDAQTALAKIPALNPGDIVLLQLEIPFETVEAVAAHAKQQGATVILDPAPFQPLPSSLLNNIDYLTPNQTEAAAMLHINERELQNLDSIKQAAIKILATGPAAVILKLGAQGCRLQSASCGDVIPGFIVKAVDTTAAGDTFNAAFAVALSEGKGPRAAAYFANAAAALSVTKSGAQGSIPTRAEVDKFFAAQRSL